MTIRPNGPNVDQDAPTEALAAALTPDEIAALRAVHVPVTLEASTRDPKPVWCARCGTWDSPWPCTTARLLVTLAAPLQQRGYTVATLDAPAEGLDDDLRFLSYDGAKEIGLAQGDHCVLIEASDGSVVMTDLEAERMAHSLLRRVAYSRLTDRQPTADALNTTNTTT